MGMEEGNGSKRKCTRPDKNDLHGVTVILHTGFVWWGHKPMPTQQPHSSNHTQRMGAIVAGWPAGAAPLAEAGKKVIFSGTLAILLAVATKLNVSWKYHNIWSIITFVILWDHDLLNRAAEGCAKWYSTRGV
jgi:hypothetical protein